MLTVDGLILVYILFRLFFLNLAFPYITCNFTQKRNAVASRKTEYKPYRFCDRDSGYQSFILSAIDSIKARTRQR